MLAESLKQLSPPQIEDLKKKLIFQPLNSVEELRAWMLLFFDIDFPSGVVYPTSTHGPADAMWRIYELMKTGESKDVPQVTMLSSRDSYKTLSAAAIEVLCFVHFRISIAHAAAVIDQSDKAVQYANNFFRNLKPYLEFHGWKRATDNKKKIEWITDTGESIYLRILVMSIRGMNCIVGRSEIRTNLGTLRATEIYKKLENNEDVYFLSMNHNTQQMEYKQVINKFKNTKNTLIKIKTKKSTLLVSPEHQIYVKDKGYVLAKNLVQGDRVVRAPYINTKKERKKRLPTWTLEKLKKEALKYKTRAEFNKNSPNAYKSAQTQKLLDDICTHMELIRKKWDDKSVQQEALKYNKRLDFQILSRGAYGYAKKNKMLDKICAHMDNILTEWTYDLLKKESLKYNDKNSFRKHNPNAYRVVCKRKLIQDLCSRMGKYIHLKKYSYEDIKKEALKYKTRAEFNEHSPNQYRIALHRNIVDEICAHMPVVSASSRSEKDLFVVIKMHFPKAQKLIDRKVKIDNKPHIKGFEIDIYIPELRKGIEFDGTYFHSVLGLERGRPHWPKEDVRNYHKIKDEYFKSKDIELLHITEEDWLKNKEECVNKCFKFLGIDQ